MQSLTRDTSGAVDLAHQEFSVQEQAWSAQLQAKAAAAGRVRYSYGKAALAHNDLANAADSVIVAMMSLLCTCT